MKFIFLATAILLTFAVSLAEGGSTNSSISGRIFGSSVVGSTATYPWMVIIYKTVPTPVALVGGGSIINVNWVLTSAFVAKSGTSFNIYHTTLSCSSGSLYTSSGAVPHPAYTTAFSHHNIGLLKLNTPASLNQVVKLQPRTACCDQAIYKNTFTGCGQISSSVPGASTNLRELSVPTMTGLACVTSGWGANYIIPSVICTPSSTTSSAYIFDEGDPLVQRNPSTGVVMFQVGILSLYKPPLPNIFTKVCHYHDWIQSITGVNLG